MQKSHISGQPWRVPIFAARLLTRIARRHSLFRIERAWGLPRARHGSQDFCSALVTAVVHVIELSAREKSPHFHDNPALGAVRRMGFQARLGFILGCHHTRSLVFQSVSPGRRTGALGQGRSRDTQHVSFSPLAQRKPTPETSPHKESPGRVGSGLLSVALIHHHCSGPRHLIEITKTNRDGSYTARLAEGP